VTLKDKLHSGFSHPWIMGGDDKMEWPDPFCLRPLLARQKRCMMEWAEWKGWAQTRTHSSLLRDGLAS